MANLVVGCSGGLMDNAFNYLKADAEAVPLLPISFRTPVFCSTIMSMAALGVGGKERVGEEA